MKPEFTMLIVNDSKVNRSLIKEVFKDQFTIIETRNGQEALDVLSESYESIDIIICDLVMPIMDGYEFLKIKSLIPSYKNIPVIVVTASDFVDSELEALNLGASDLISNPFNNSIFRQRVMNVILTAKQTKISHENDLIQRHNQDQKKLETILENINAGVSLIEIGESINVIYKSPQFDKRDQTNYRKNSRGYLEFNYKNESDAEKIKQCIRKATKTWEYFALKIPVLSSNYDTAWMQFQGVRIKYPERKNPVVLTVTTDITEQVTNEEKIRYQAEFDILTGIYNKESFYLHTKTLIEENPEIQFIIIRWNIERFKIINDLFGTKAGDNLLKQIADYLRKTTGKTGTYGRIDADNFAVCIPKREFDVCKYYNNIELFCENLKLNFKPVISLGIYTVSDTSVPVNQMCDRAYLALKTIKGNALKHYAYYDKTLRNALLREQEIFSDMESALTEHQFVVYLQPIISFDSRRIQSAEALVRWIHPRKGLIPPSDFIPLFEKNGFIEKLDYYVWEEVCKYLKERDKRKLPPLSISVNISRVNIQMPDICNILIDLTEKYGIDKELFKLEITESAYTDNPEELLEKINILRQNGFIVMMDDFGSGYSSLNLLKDFPIDYIKIDMEFLKDDEISGKAASILTSVVRMAKRLNIKTIAEGVETKAHIDFLRSIGCDNLQGYYFSRPMSIPDFEKHAEIDIEPLAESFNLIKTKSQFDYVLRDNLVGTLLFNNIHSGVAVYKYDKSGFEAFFTNESWNLIFGVDKSVKSNENHLQNLSRSDYEQVLKLCDSLCMSNKTSSMKAFINNSVWIQLNITYLDGNESAKILCVTADDITEFKKLSDENAAVKQKFTQYLDDLKFKYNNVELGIIESPGDRPGESVCNDFVWKMLGYQNKEGFLELYKKDNYFFIHPDDKAYAMIIKEYQVKMKNTVRYEIRFIKKDGTVIHVTGVITNFNDAESHCILNSFLEIPDNEQQKYTVVCDKMEEYHSYLQPIYEPMLCGVIQYTIDKKPLILNANSAFLNIFGIDPGTSLTAGSEVSSFSEIYSKFLSDNIPDRKNMLENKKCRLNFTDKDGKTKKLLSSFNITVLPDGTKIFEDVYSEI